MIIKHSDCSKDCEYQDKRYGMKRRVVNKMELGQYRCTVCGKILDGKGVSARQFVKEFK